MGEIREEQKAKLYFKTMDNSEKEFDCFIKEVQKDRLSLTFPNEILDYTEYLQEGSELPVKIYTPSGVKAFETIIINSPMENEFVIEFVEDHMEIQRREYLRVDLEAKLILESQRHGVIVTNTLDISGGGLRFVSDRQFSPKDQVKIMLYLPFQASSVKAAGEIVECGHLPEDQYVMVFTDIEDKERDRVVKQCFDTQTELYN